MAYLGKSPGFGIRGRYHFTATAGQTVFSGADDNLYTLKYADSKYMDVYLNGVLLVDNDDYTATTLTSVTLTTGATAGDILEIVAYELFSLADLSQYTNTLKFPVYDASNTKYLLPLTLNQALPITKSDGTTDTVNLTN
jgi:hypothetical protein